MFVLSGHFFSQAGLEGSGKNPKSRFFLLGLKYTLRTCFESKKFLSKSCPELSNQVLSLSNFLVVTSSSAAHFFQLFDIWWSILDIINGS